MAMGSALPEAVREGLTDFTAAARQAFAADLLSIVLFGSAAEGRLRQASDVNVVVVLRRDDPKNLRQSARRIVRPCRHAWVSTRNPRAPAAAADHRCGSGCGGGGGGGGCGGCGSS